MGSASGKSATVAKEKKARLEVCDSEQILVLEKISPLFPDPMKILSLAPDISEVEAFKKSKLFRTSRYTAVSAPTKVARNTLASPHRFLEMTLSSLSFSDQCFDIILCNEILPFIKSDYAVIAEIHRCLRADGVAMLGVPGIIEKTMRAGEARERHPELYKPGMEWIFGRDFFERIKAAGLFPLYLPRKGLILCFKYRGVREGLREILDGE